MDAYRSANWKEFKRHVMTLDGNTCSVCGRGESSGVVLQVHHRRYLVGRKPWEYPYELCTTLCKGCHAAEHGIVPPKFGWEFAGWDDLGELSGNCECCGTAIRYCFIVTHANWGALEVGEVCCDNLTSTQVASGFMESKRRYSSRLKRFVGSSRWMMLPGGALGINQQGLVVRVVSSRGGFRVVMNGVSGKAVHADVLSAKVAAFDAIESGAARRYLVKKGFASRARQ